MRSFDLPDYFPSLTRLVLSSNPFLARPPVSKSTSKAPSRAITLLLDYPLPDEIVPGVYLGSVECAWNRHGLKSLAISHILTIAFYEPCYPDLFTYSVVPVDDRNSEDLLSNFPSCFEFIETALKQGHKVLVHCRHGASRSAAVVMSFLMKYRGMSVDQAYAFVKEKRNQVAPNDGFIAQLHKWEESLHISR